MPLTANTPLRRGGSPGSTTRVALPDVTALPVFAVGTGADPSAAALREAVGAAVRTTTGFAHLAVGAPGGRAGDWRRP